MIRWKLLKLSTEAKAWRHKKLNLWNYGICRDFMKEQCPKAAVSNLMWRNWSRSLTKNNFQLNESKCKELRISFAKSAADFAPIVINGKAIEVVSTVKLLGLNISSDLRWNCHVAEISKKVASRLYFLKQLKRANISAKDLLIFYLPGLYPPSNGIRMLRVSQRASRIFIRRARRATEARHANYFSVCTI